MIDLTFNGKDLGFNGNNLAYINGPVDPYNPLNLPSGTIRYRFGDPSYDPNNSHVSGIWTQVSSSPNVWDWSLDPLGSQSLIQRFNGAFLGIGTVEILGANLNGMKQPDLDLTWGDSGITSVAMMDTRNIGNFRQAFSYCRSLQYVADGIPVVGTCFMMFAGCTALQRVPLLEIMGVSDIQEMFEGCNNVEGGILDFYNRYQSITPPGGRHWACFRNCGINTTTGAAELAQLPDDWK